MLVVIVPTVETRRVPPDDVVIDRAVLEWSSWSARTAGLPGCT